MTERMKALREWVLRARDAGPRARYLGALAQQSLRHTAADAPEIRRAKAQAHILDSAPLVLCPGELLVSSPMGCCPEDPAAPDYAHLRKAGERVRDALLAADAGILPPERTGLTQRTCAAAGASFCDQQRLARELAMELHGADLAKGALQAALSRALDGGQSAADRALAQLPWVAASHFAPDFQTVLNVGFRGLDSIAQRGVKAAADADKARFFQAQRIALGAAQRFILRYANAVAGEANRSAGARRAELSAMAQTLRKLATERADTFYEGVQLVLLILTMGSLLGCWSMAAGRLDQLLGARYDEDLRSGDITEADAKELLCCLFIKLNEPGHLGTCAITLGGTASDGSDGANQLTALCLQAAKEARLPHPAIAVRLGAASPDWLVKAASECAATGLGQPLCLSDDAWIERLIRRGIPYQAAHDYCLLGACRIGIPGQSAGMADAGAIALPALIERVWARGESGQLALTTFDQFLEGYKQELSLAAADIWLAAHERARAMDCAAFDPFSSMLIRGCAASGRDALGGGGALGRAWCVELVGLATAADALCAIKKWAYDKGGARPEALAQAARDGFSGRTQLLRLLRMTPRYGNDIEEVDAIARAVLVQAAEAVGALSLSGPGDRFWPALSDGERHASLGERMAAGFDGRRQGEPLSSGAEAHPGRDVGGLSALIRSAASLSVPQLTGGFSLNLALSPDALGRDGAASALLRRCLDAQLPAFRLCAQDTEALLDARGKRDRALTACAGGLCDWFCELDQSLQDEVIRRTVHE